MKFTLVQSAVLLLASSTMVASQSVPAPTNVQAPANVGAPANWTSNTGFVRVPVRYKEVPVSKTTVSTQSTYPEGNTTTRIQNVTYNATSGTGQGNQGHRVEEVGQLTLDEGAIDEGHGEFQGRVAKPGWACPYCLFLCC